MADNVNVVEFPETMVVQWKPYERMLRERYNAGGKLSPATIDDTLARLRPLFLKHARLANENPNAQAGVGDALDQIQAWVAQLTLGLLSEIAERENKLIDLQRE